MISVVTERGAKGLLNDSFPFFDFEEYQVKNGIETVVSHENAYRFLDTGLTPEYSVQERLIVDWLLSSFVKRTSEVWIRPVLGKWLIARYEEARKDPVHQALRGWLDEYGLKNSFSGFVRTRRSQVLSWSITATLRGYTQLQLLVPESQLILAPCDHGEVHLFLGANCPYINQIRRLLIPGMAMVPYKGFGPDGLKAAESGSTVEESKDRPLMKV